MQGSGQVGHSYVCKVGIKWDTLMCDPPILHIDYQNSYLQYTVNHICAQRINLRLVPYLISS